MFDNAYYVLYAHCIYPLSHEFLHRYFMHIYKCISTLHFLLSLCVCRLVSMVLEDFALCCVSRWLCWAVHCIQQLYASKIFAPALCQSPVKPLACWLSGLLSDRTLLLWLLSWSPRFPSCCSAPSLSPSGGFRMSFDDGCCPAFLAAELHWDVRWLLFDPPVFCPFGARFVKRLCSCGLRGLIVKVA